MSGFCIETMNQEEFAELVGKAVADLPEEFLDSLENVDIVVAEYPTDDQLRERELANNETLLGLYEGIPQTRRTSGYGMVLPDKITIFQKPIEAMCHDDSKLYAEITKVLKHEIAHHFGISDARLREIEKE